ncbi:MAG: hypothetical protein AAGD43_00885 [Pseudomonadota bacterium]
MTKQEIVEKIAFIVVTDRENALVIGSLSSSAPPKGWRDDWNDLKVMAERRSARAVAASGHWEIWLARKIQVAHLRATLSGTEDKAYNGTFGIDETGAVTSSVSVLWHEKFAGSPLKLKPTDFDDDTKLKTYLPFSGEEISQIELEAKFDDNEFKNDFSGSLNHPYKRLLKQDERDRRRYVSGFKRFLAFYDNREPVSGTGDGLLQPFIDFATANPSEAAGASLRSRLFTISYTVDHDGSPLELPFLKYIDVRPIVRLPGNAHKSSGQDPYRPAMRLSACRIGRAPTDSRPTLSLFEPSESDTARRGDGTMGFDFIRYGASFEDGETASTFNDSDNWFERVSNKDFHARLTDLAERQDELEGELPAPLLYWEDDSHHIERSEPPPALEVLDIPYLSQSGRGFSAAALCRDVSVDGVNGKRPALLLRFDARFHAKRSTLPGGKTHNWSEANSHGHLVLEQPVGHIEAETRSSIVENVVPRLEVPDKAEWHAGLAGYDEPLVPPGFNADVADFVEHWNTFAERYGSSIEWIEDSRRLSLLPILKSASGGSLPWVLFGRLTDRSPVVREIKASQLTGSWRFYAPVAGGFDWLQSDPEENANLSGRLLAMLDHDGKPLQLKQFQLNFPPDVETGLLSVDPEATPDRLQVPFSQISLGRGIDWRFGLEPDAPPKDKPEKSVRLGALDFDFLNEATARYSIGFEVEERDEPILRVRLRTWLYAYGVRQQAEDTPGRGVGDTADDINTRPLIEPPDGDRAVLVPFDALKVRPDGRASVEPVAQLVATEHTGELSSRTLEIELLGLSTQTADSDGSASPSGPDRQGASWYGGEAEIAYFNRAPFMVAASEVFDIDRIQGNSADNRIAVWQIEDGVGRWAVKAPGQRSRLLLPSMATGETMERQRSTELAKRPKNSDGGEDAGSADDGGNDKTYVPPNLDFTEDERADFRFGPVTELELDTSVRDTEFGEQPLNIQRLFASQRNPDGSGLYRAAFELLYGMSSHVAPTSVEADQASMMLADAVSREGRFAPLLSEDLTRGHRARWRALRAALDSRLMVLEVRSEVGEPHRLTDKVQFRLRDNAHLRHPTLAMPEDKSGGYSEAVPAPFNPDGLAGGVGWLFESRNIVESVWRNPVSNDASIDHLAFSAGGGYGTPRGLFDNRRAIIEATTAAGRVHRLRLEQVGRIACFWNRCKHVVIYERSVVPSPQFVNEDPRIGEKQEQHTGRPILRKVEEYIDILETNRRFDTSVDPSDPGCLRACAFRSTRIHIDSDWGRDVGRTGWEVPLWQKELGGPSLIDRNPFPVSEIYPKPKIDLIMIDEDGQETTCEIDEPEKLRFFRSTAPGDTDNTDAWSPAHSVDYPDALEPRIPSASEHPIPITDGMLESPPDAAPGWPRFTIGLVRDGTRVRIGHGRAEESPAVALGNVSIARARPQATVGGGDLTQLTRGLSDLAGLSDVALDRFDALVANLNPARIDATVVNSINEARRRYEEFLGQIDQQYQSRVKEKLDAAKDVVDNIDSTLDKLINSDPCEALIAELQRALNNGQSRFETFLYDGHSEIGTGLAHAESKVQTVRLQVANITNTALRDALLKEVLSHREDLLNRVEIFFSQLRSAAKPNLGLIDNVFAEAESSILQAKRLTQKSIVRIRGTIEFLIKKIDDGQHEVDEARADLTRIEQTLIAKAAQVKKLATRVRPLAKIPEAARKLAGNVRKLRTELGSVTDLKSELNDLLTKLEDLEDELGNVADAALSNLKDYKSKIFEKRMEIIKDGEDAFIQFDKKAFLDLNEVIEEFNKISKYIGSTDGAAIQQQLQNVETSLRTVRIESRAWLDRELAGIRVTFSSELEKIKPEAVAICEKIIGKVDDLKSEISDGFSFIESLDPLATLGPQIQNAINGAEGAWDELRDAWETQKDQINRHRAALLRATESVRENVADFVEDAQNAFQRGDRALRLVRAIGNPPNVPAIDTNREDVAYVIDTTRALGVDVTPVVARVNRVASQAAAVGDAAEAVEDLMASFGIAMPIRELGSELVPDNLRNFDISRVFPDMSGLKLPALFSDFKFPEFSNQLDAIKVAHGFDKQTRAAWLKASVAVPLGKPAEIFALGPVKLALNSGDFAAEAQVRSQLGGQTTQSSSGAVKGDFALDVAGWKVINFRDTSLTFDDSGQVKFDVSPDRIELADALRFLVDILSKVAADSGFEIEAIEAGGETIGLSAALDLTLPDLGAGAFAISGLKFYAAMEIVLKPGFGVGVRLSLGTRNAPFQLIIAFLTGGGYVISQTRYIAADGSLTQELALSANAGAGAGFNFGVVKGHVSLVVGIEVAFYWRNRGSSSLSIELYVLARGGITVLGLLHVDLSIRLAIRYESSGSLYCYGSLTFTVRLSVFAKIKVRERASYRLSGRSSSDNYADGYA